MTNSYTYEGLELEIFAAAKNWRNYWSSLIYPYLVAEVLEVGAGIGSITKLLANPTFKWTALEPDPELSNRITDWVVENRISSVNVVTGTLEQIPESRQYNSILYIDVLEHIEDDQTEIVTAYEHLVKGGSLIILVPAHNFLYSSFDRAIGHFRRYNKRQLCSLKPKGAQQSLAIYLDSVGMLASIGNKLFLKSSMPSRSQILLWDRWFVPFSRWIDRITNFQIGKSLLVVFTKP